MSSKVYKGDSTTAKKGTVRGNTLATRKKLQNLYGWAIIPFLFYLVVRALQAKKKRLKGKGHKKVSGTAGPPTTIRKSKPGPSASTGSVER